MSSPSMCFDDLAIVLPSLPPEIFTMIYDHVFAPSKPSDYLKLLPLSREHYDKFILRLYHTVTLNSGNAEQFCYGLGPRFGWPAPSKEALKALEDICATFRKDVKKLNADHRIVSHAESSNVESGSEVKMTVGVSALVDQIMLPYVQHHPYTDPFIRKYHLLDNAITNLFVEDVDAVWTMVEAGDVVEQLPYDLWYGGRLSDKLSGLSLSPSVLERYGLSPYAWSPIFDRFFPLFEPTHLCIRLPDNISFPIRTVSLVFENIRECLDQYQAKLKSLTIHNVDQQLFDVDLSTRRIAVDGVRLFLKGERNHIKSHGDDDDGHSGSDLAAKHSHEQMAWVKRDLRALRILQGNKCVYILQCLTPPLPTVGDRMHDLSTQGIWADISQNSSSGDVREYGWDVAEYLNFLPAESETFDAERDLGLDAAGRAGDFYGRGEGKPCRVCGGR